MQQLHQILRPHFLRRMKKEVMPILPPKAEILVPVTLSPLQKVRESFFVFFFCPEDN